MAEYILSDYISKALAQAVYEKFEDGTYAGKIPELQSGMSYRRK
jgi:hypothetical protein